MKMICYSGKRLFLKYIKENLSKCILAFLCMFVLGATLMLSGISWENIWYPMLINICIVVTYAAVDFIKYLSRHRELRQLLNNIDVTVESLPEPKTLMEKDYQELLKKLSNWNNDEINKISNSRKDTMEYVTIWTHHVKTPLTALQLLASDIQGPDKSEIMARLIEIEQYSDMMLQYLRLDSQNTDYVLQEYTVKSMVNQTVKYYARTFISKGISVKVDIPEDFTVITDEKWMVFVLKQLMSNAIKYTNKGWVSVYIKDKSIVIEDTGIGIAKEDLPRIFEKGYTGYNGRKDKKATGLGLFLVNIILNRLNHSIFIESEINEGTKVIIKF